MNAAVSIAARYVVNHGVQVLGSRDEFHGLIHGDFIDLDWHELVSWVGHPSSDIGTARFDPDRRGFRPDCGKYKKIQYKGNHCHRWVGYVPAHFAVCGNAGQFS